MSLLVVIVILLIKVLNVINKYVYAMKDTIDNQ